MLAKLFIIFILFFVFPVYSSSNFLSYYQLISLEPSSEVIIKLDFSNKQFSKADAYIISVPETGDIFQLSQVYSDYGYEPKYGLKIKKEDLPVKVTGSNNRFIYKRPDRENKNQHQKYGEILFKFQDKSSEFSSIGKVLLVPPSGEIISSSFLKGDEGWKVSSSLHISPLSSSLVQNSQGYVSSHIHSLSNLSSLLNNSLKSPKYEKFSRGPLLNMYITASDNLIHSTSFSNPDSSLWYFEAPSSFLGNLGMGYDGTFEFSFSLFSGDISLLNPLSTNVVELWCESCNNGKGIRLGYSLEQLLKTSLPIASHLKNGSGPLPPFHISIPLHEHKGWKKDTYNDLSPWVSITKCDMIQVLSRLSRVRILGDWTMWHETAALDNVKFVNKKFNNDNKKPSDILPLCAISVTDASICTC